MKIGFYDSGFGGITILKEALKHIKKTHFFYLADNLNVPYGNKKKEELNYIVSKNIELMILNKCDIIVIACNTATSAAIKEVRQKYKDVCIIGTEPAVKPALEYSLNINGNNKVLVTATIHTLNGEKLNDLVKAYDANHLVKKQELSKLVEFAENGNYTKEDIIKYLKSVINNKEEYSSIVLGCTHFPLFKNEIKEFFNNDIQIFDSSNGVVKNILTKIDDDFKVVNNAKENNKINDNNLNTLELYLTKESKKYRETFYNILNK